MKENNCRSILNAIAVSEIELVLNIYTTPRENLLLKFCKPLHFFSVAVLHKVVNENSVLSPPLIITLLSFPWEKVSTWGHHTLAVGVGSTSLAILKITGLLSQNLIWVSCHWRSPQNVMFNFLQSVITRWRPHKLLRWEWKQRPLIQRNVK